MCHMNFSNLYTFTILHLLLIKYFILREKYNSNRTPP
jgi:hypothetical protein